MKRRKAYVLNEQVCTYQETEVLRNQLNEVVQKYINSEELSVVEYIHILTGINYGRLKELYDANGLEFIKHSSEFSAEQNKKLRAIYKVAEKMMEGERKEKVCFDSSDKARNFFENKLKFKEVEVFCAAFLTAQNRLIAFDELWTGTVNESPIFVREILKKAINYNAVSVIIGHNHPGGSLSPSYPDIKATEKLKECLNNLEIKLLDHILVTSNGTYSFAENGKI